MFFAESNLTAVSMLDDESVSIVVAAGLSDFVRVETLSAAGALGGRAFASVRGGCRPDSAEVSGGGFAADRSAIASRASTSVSALPRRAAGSGAIIEPMIRNIGSPSAPPRIAWTIGGGITSVVSISPDREIHFHIHHPRAYKSEAAVAGPPPRISGAIKCSRSRGGSIHPVWADVVSSADAPDGRPGSTIKCHRLGPHQTRSSANGPKVKPAPCNIAIEPAMRRSVCNHASRCVSKWPGNGWLMSASRPSIHSPKNSPAGNSINTAR